MSDAAADRAHVCALDELPPGSRRVVELRGRRIGVFNVDGSVHALHDRCPHRAGPVCAGPLTGTRAVDASGRPVYRDAGRILRCAWHGWEFDVTTGRCLADPRVRVRRFPVEVVDGHVYVSAGATA
jgi:nitrite reductase/ring-hydroxylating ferredoxin subunit